MQGRKNFKDEKELLFSLSAHVPEHNFYRRLKQLLDLSFLYELTAPLYGKCGQQSIDPVVFFKLCLVGYLENIVSDRKLLEHCSLRLDLLYFLDYQLDEPLPWHSTLSRTRCRKITRTAYDEQYQRAYARQHSKRGKMMKKLRQSTLEPVFGSLVQHYGLRKVNVLGKSGAHKVMLLAAVAFNLSKYMKSKSIKSISMAMALEKEQQRLFQVFLMRSWEYAFPTEKPKLSIEYQNGSKTERM